jgi:hypothetical protein
VKNWARKNMKAIYQRSREKRMAYYQANAEKIKKYARSQYHKNRVHLIKGVVAYGRHKYETDPVYKIQRICRKRLTYALQKIKANKTAHTKELIGCDWKFLKEHIESKFQRGMTWHNHGTFGWHVDHIVPIAAFDLTKAKEQKRCFHFTNLQPLWAADNLQKGDS